MKIFGRTQPLKQLGIGACLKRLAQLGFDGVELCLEHPDCVPASLDEARAAAIAAMVKEAGLAGQSVSLHVDYIHDDRQFQDTLKAIALTPAFGADTFVFAGGRAKLAPAESWRIMRERTRAMVRAADDAHVRLAIEFEPEFTVGNSADVLRLINEVGSPALGANLDIGHVFLCDPSPADAIAALRGRIFHGHVENMPRGVHRHLPPYEGDMDLAAYFRNLELAGFRGPMALDLYQQDYEAVAPRSLAFLRALPAGAANLP